MNLSSLLKGKADTVACIRVIRVQESQQQLQTAFKHSQSLCTAAEERGSCAKSRYDGLQGRFQQLQSRLSASEEARKLAEQQHLDLMKQLPGGGLDDHESMVQPLLQQIQVRYN